MNLKVKICGITRAEEIEMVNKSLPDYIGFVFTTSRVMITPEEASRLVEGLDKRIKKVGVFVDREQEEVKEIAHICKLDVLQFHGSETAKYCSRFAQQVWKAIGIENSQSLDILDHYKVDAILLDSVVQGKCGGTGKTFDWSIIDGISEKYNIILAGGLNEDNVSHAIRKVRPFCVDVSSGVETNGIKDGNKIDRFIKLVRGVV